MSAPETAVSACPKQWGRSKMNVSKITYDWTITEFSLRPEEVKEKMISPVFYSVENKNDQWRLELYPRGDNSDNKNHLSLFLQLVATDEPEIPLQCKFSILKADTNMKTNTKKFFRKYMVGMTLGYPSYVSRTHLLDQSNGLLTDDVLVICCEIDIPKDTISTSWIDDARPEPKHISKRRLVDDLRVLFDESKFSDVTIVVDNKKFPTHKSILASRSPVFAAMFSHSLREEQRNLVHIDDMRPDVVKGMLQFIYTDEVPDLEKLLNEYLGAAEKYQLSGMKEKCEEAILERVNEENAALYLVIADRFNADGLKAKLMSYITKHLPGIVGSAAFKEMEEKHTALLGHIIRAQVKLMEEKTFDEYIVE
ncbi:speckle-type POZ protein-like [Diachasma alloeum]|uniref:speckle-type POZ protein-like n=1 Tax=Diachasma alloeum TaxID=454923 RepID=UPI0010FB8AA1|nr:speckle-type POZ protein-like [Diachasma alloeum]